MRVSEEWIRSWVNPAVDSDALCEQLTMAGLEVESNDPVSQHFSGVVVGQVTEVTPHPDADRLRITQVDVGTQTLQIVCGAPNVTVGMKAPVAMAGAVLPGGLKIKKGKLRGAESNGMLCGASEIGLVDEIDGLLELDSEAPVGTDIRDFLGLDERVIDISITPNRGDCLSVRGIARELAVINELDFVDVAPTEISFSEEATLGVSVHTDECPVYISAQVDALQGQSDELIRRRLARAGVTPRTLAVDLTNYVMLETGQPLHAFDADKLSGPLQVRLGQAGEKLTLLNEQQIVLTGDELVIADGSGVIALAGIMGGLSTAVDENTQRVVFESAHFKQLAIAGRARRFGLHTDASARFERGVDPALPKLAMRRLLGLVKEHCGAAVIYAPNEHLNWQPEQAEIKLSLDQIERRLGVRIAPETVQSILTRLGFDVQTSTEGWQVTAPSHRFDAQIPEDLIEELARIYGYAKITAQEPLSNVRLKPLSDQLSAAQLRQILVAQGFYEAISFSFAEEKLDHLFSEKSLKLLNPISQDLGVMRSSLFSSLIPCVLHNLNRQQAQIRLFETGLRFEGAAPADLRQIPTLGMVACGPIEAQGHEAANKRDYDFYDLKHDVLLLLRAARISDASVSFVRGNRSHLHPGQSADILIDGRCIGYLGALHPSVASELGLQQLWVAQIDLDDLYQPASIKALPVSKFPSVRRDLAVIVDESVTAAELLATAMRGDLRMIDAWVFDIYRSSELGDDLKSVALALIWQDAEQTIEEESTAAAFMGAIDRLKQEHRAILRDS